MTTPTLIAFDADETLFRTQFLYDEARQAVVDMVAAKSGRPAQEVEAWQRAHDVELSKLHGYSMHRFPTGLQDTARHFLGEGEHEMAALGMGYNVFRRKSDPLPGVYGALTLAKTAGVEIAIITAGDTSVQHKRLNDFEYLDLFDPKHVHIVPTKHASIFASVGIGRSQSDCWMIGDSLKSDILPAVEAGWNAVHVPAHNWAAVEMQGHALPERAHVAPTLLDAVIKALGDQTTIAAYHKHKEQVANGN